MATNILGDISAHVSKIMNVVHEKAIDPSDIPILDHLCYRVETIERYEEMKQKLGEIAVKIGESEINERMISIFELHEQLHAGRYRIPYIELPAPKEGSPYPEGLEHAEFVVLGGLENFRQKYEKRINFDTRAYNIEDINPELGLKVGGVAMKFHGLAINEVVRIEQHVLDK